VEPERALRQHIETALIDLGFPTQETRAQRLCDLAHFTLRWARRINLTGFESALELTNRLLLPPFAWLPYLPPRPKRIADLGSGAGFPGIPLSLAFPASAVMLIESRERRHHFQRAACRHLSLLNVQPVLGRIESLPATPCDMVVAQALAPPHRAVDLMRRWAGGAGAMLVIPIGSKALLPDGPDWVAARVIEYPRIGFSTPGYLWCARLAS